MSRDNKALLLLYFNYASLAFESPFVFMDSNILHNSKVLVLTIHMVLVLDISFI